MISLSINVPVDSLQNPYQHIPYSSPCLQIHIMQNLTANIVTHKQIRPPNKLTK